MHICIQNQGVNYVIIGGHVVSNAPKCPLINGVSIVQKLVVKLSNTSTMLFPPDSSQNGF